MIIMNNMKSIIIQSYETNSLRIGDFEKSMGLNIVLLDERNVPVARYEFDANSLEHVNEIVCQANNVRIAFDKVPTMKCELSSICG